MTGLEQRVSTVFIIVLAFLSSNCHQSQHSVLLRAESFVIRGLEIISAGTQHISPTICHRR